MQERKKHATKKKTDGGLPDKLDCDLGCEGDCARMLVEKDETRGRESEGGMGRRLLTECQVWKEGGKCRIR